MSMAKKKRGVKRAKCRHQKTASFPLDPARNGNWYVLVWCESCGAARYGCYQGILGECGPWWNPQRSKR